MKYETIEPINHNGIDHSNSILKALHKEDVLLHFPYQPFTYVIDFLREASIDEKVESIKITLYRVAKDSNIIKALINASQNGKK